MTLTCYANVHHQFINIPKNASTSILAAMFGIGGKSVEDIHVEAAKHRELYRENGPPAFVVLRHPWRRFYSTWMNKVYQPHRPDTNLIKMGCHAGMDLYEFANYCLAKPELFNDPHLRPQSEYLPDGAYDVLVHEDLDIYWDRLGYSALYGPLERLNSTDHPAPPHRTSLRGAIEAKYRKDMQQWNLAFGSY